MKPVTEPVPTDIRSGLRHAFGIDVGDRPIRRGPEVTAQARAIGARAFTRGGEVFMPMEEGPLSGTRARGVVAHELTHVAQQRRLGPSLPSPLSPGGRRLELGAQVSERYYRGDPDAPAPGPELLHPTVPHALTLSGLSDSPSAYAQRVADELVAQGLAHRDWDHTLVFGPAPDSPALADVQALTMDATQARLALINSAERQVLERLQLEEEEIQRRRMTIEEWRRDHTTPRDEANAERWLWASGDLERLQSQDWTPLRALREDQYEARTRALAEGVAGGSGSSRGPGGGGGGGGGGSGGGTAEERVQRARQEAATAGWAAATAGLNDRQVVHMNMRMQALIADFMEGGASETVAQTAALLVVQGKSNEEALSTARQQIQEERTFQTALVHVYEHERGATQEEAGEAATLMVQDRSLTAAAALERARVQAEERRQMGTRGGGRGAAVGGLGRGVGGAGGGGGGGGGGGSGASGQTVEERLASARARQASDAWGHYTAGMGSDASAFAQMRMMALIADLMSAPNVSEADAQAAALLMIQDSNLSAVEALRQARTTAGTTRTKQAAVVAVMDAEPGISQTDADAAADLIVAHGLTATAAIERARTEAEERRQTVQREQERRRTEVAERLGTSATTSTSEVTSTQTPTPRVAFQSGQPHGMERRSPDTGRLRVNPEDIPLRELADRLIDPLYERLRTRFLALQERRSPQTRP